MFEAHGGMTQYWQRYRNDRENSGEGSVKYSEHHLLRV